MAEKARWPTDRKDHDSPLHEQICLWLFRNAEKLQLVRELRKHVPTLQVTPQLEHPITRNGWVNGFVDVLVGLRIDPERDNVHHDRRLDGRPSSPNGEPNWWRNGGLAIEVKGVLPSIGELLAQLNYYRSQLFGSGIAWALCAPDSRYADVLAAHNILFIQYEG